MQHRALVLPPIHPPHPCYPHECIVPIDSHDPHSVFPARAQVRADGTQLRYALVPAPCEPRADHVVRSRPVYVVASLPATALRAPGVTQEGWFSLFGGLPSTEAIAW